MISLAEAQLRAVVIAVSEAAKRGRACDMREIVNIAGALAKKREGTRHNVPILEIFYSARLGVYVAIYEAQTHTRMASLGRSGKERK